MSHSIDSELDSAIHAQLYQISPVRDWGSRSSARSGDSGTEYVAGQVGIRGVRTFTISAFISLLEMLNVSFINTQHICLGLTGSNTPYTPIGRGGFSEVGYDELELPDESTSVAVAVKAFSPVKIDARKAKEMEKICETTITQAFIEVCIMKHPHLVVHKNIVDLLGVSQLQSATSSLQRLRHYSLL